MAEANQAAEELARTMAKLNEEMALYGRTTAQTEQAKTDANMKAKYGIENFSAGTAQAAKSLESLGGAALASMKAMAEGKKGAAAFNGALDEMASAAMAAGAALALLVPGGIIFKALTAAVTAATVAYIKFTQMTLEMVDKLHKGYQGMAKSGAAAADGMSGLYGDAKKLGLSMGELDSFVQLVAENSKDFALFAGSVGDGRKRLAEMGAAAAGNRVELMNLGMTTQEINTGMAGYIRLQTRLGQAQNMTTQQLAAGAVAYLKEQDALTKLTGQSRQEMEQQRERALQKEQFAAKIQELRNNNQAEAAERLLKLNSIYEAAGPQMASAFQASVTGNLSNADAQKANLASNGELIRSTQLVIENRMTEVQAAQSTGLAIKQTANTIGTTLGQFGAYNNTFGELHEQLKLAQMAEGNLVKNYEKILADQKNQLAGTDAMTRKQSELIQSQIENNRKMEEILMSNADNAQTQMKKLADASLKAAEALGKISGKVAERSTEENVGATAGALAGSAAGWLGGKAVGGYIGGAIGSLAGPGGTVVGAAIGQQVGPYIVSALGGLVGGYVGDKAGGAMAGPEARAVGGPVSKSTPYLVGENGPEIFVPKAAGDIVPNDKLSTGAAVGDNFSAAIDEMFKDVKKQEKILDVDTVRMRQFSDLQKEYFTVYGGYMKDVIDQVEDNNPNDENSSIGQMFKLSSIFGSMSPQMTEAFRASTKGNMGGGGGLQMPRASNMANMSGPGSRQGLNGPEEHSAVGGGGQGLKGPPKLVSVRSKTGKSAEVNAEYAPRFQSLIDYLDSIGYEINSLGGYIDRDVRGRPGVKSVHAHGAAIDINPSANPMGGQLVTDLPENISSIAKGLGLGWGGNWASIKDAMHFSVAANEGGDIKLSDGGVAVGPNSGYPATLHGEEAVIPLNNGGGNFVKLFESMADSNNRMVGMLEELVRAQKNGNDISSKMLRMQT